MDVGLDDFISFRDPNNLIGFPIVNEGTADRLLTGGDIDPKFLDRAHNGDLWVGDEFGPWILHSDATGVLLDRPFEIPACGRRTTRGWPAHRQPSPTAAASKPWR